MANELTPSQQGIVDIAGQNTDLTSVLKPLIKEIHLFDTYVAGTTHLKDSSPLERIEVGDKLTLQREKNKYDENAIMISNSAGEKLGYIPEKDNIIFSRLLDAGKLLIGRIGSITVKGNFRQVAIGIFLVDY